jgi:inosine/xanthosine triphosphatase
MRVAVGSTNPVKIKAVKNTLKCFSIKASVKGVKVDSNAPPQPIGQNSIIKGAISRARRALRSGDFDLGVGIEAGLVNVAHVQSRFLDVEWCAIVDKRGAVTLGHSSGFEYPRVVIEAVMKEKEEIAKIMERLTGIKNIGRRMGAIGYLSRGKLNRVKFTEQAVFMAMLPHIREELYGLINQKTKQK